MTPKMIEQIAQELNAHRRPTVARSVDIRIARGGVGRARRAPIGGPAESARLMSSRRTRARTVAGDPAKQFGRSWVMTTGAASFSR